MTASPMPRWQNALALVATIVAAAALLPLAPYVRIGCAAVAAALILVMFTLRLRAHGVRDTELRRDDTYARVARMRAQRAGSRRARR